MSGDGTNASGPARARPSISRAALRAARRQCRSQRPDVCFAAQQLPGPRRYAVFVLHALVAQLDEIMGPPQVRATAGGCGTGACGADGCEGESVPQRRAVCAAVLDHLFTGQPTGKPQLDAFPTVREYFHLPRGLFDRMLDGMAAVRTLPRYATWARLHGVLGDSAGSAALLAARLMADDPAALRNETAAGQVRSLGVAVALMHALLRIGADRRDGRIMLPLDDLVAASLTERDVGRFAEQGAAGVDERWVRFMQGQRRRIVNLLRGGSRAMALLSSQACRRAVAGAVLLPWRRLELLGERGDDPFRDCPALSGWSRLKLLPRMARWAADAADVDRVLGLKG